MWCKETAYENDARVPLLIRAPWLATSSPRPGGSLVSDPVELIDVFPTLAALALPSAAATLPAQLQGKSLAALMTGGGTGGRNSVAFSLYPRWRQFDNHSHCFRPYAEIKAIGLSVRTADFRLTDWLAWCVVLDG